MQTRRRLTFATAAWIALPAFTPLARAQPSLRATPAQTEGPFYPVRLPDDDDADLLQRRGQAAYAHGQPAWVEGVLTDLAGRPLRGGTIEIWQCDHTGRYHHPGDGDRADPAFQGFGRMTVGADGRYRFRTLRPVAYSGRAPHIHVKVKLGARELLTTQLYIDGEARNQRDGLWRSLDADERAALTRPFVSSADGLRAEFPIAVRA